jgi:hypothetical protein
MNSVMTGYRKEISQSLGLSHIFLGTSPRLKVEPFDVVRFPNNMGNDIEGKIMIILDTYLTIQIHPNSSASVIIFREDWDKLEVVLCSQSMENRSVLCV